MTRSPDFPIRGLSLLQPWASLVAIGAKKTESRSWQTFYRGEIAIHASRYPASRSDQNLLLDYFCDPVFKRALDYGGIKSLGVGGERPTPRHIPFGAIVAIVDLVNTRPTGFSLPPPEWVDALSADERAFGDYRPGRFGWFLENVRRLPEPVPCRGFVGLWDVPEDAAAAVERQLRESEETGQ